jgi:hypothetical protein
LRRPTYLLLCELLHNDSDLSVRADSHSVMFPFCHHSIFILSEWSVFALSVIFSHLPEQHLIEGLCYFHQTCSPIRFSKRQLAAIVLMLDEEEKNSALSDKKKHMWVHKCFRSRKSVGEYWTLHRSRWWQMKFYQYFRMSKHQFNYLLKKVEKRS